MSKDTNDFFEDLKAGLEEGIEYARGQRPLRRTTLDVPPARRFTAEDVVRLRERSGLSQRGFAALMNVSVKTVQGWEQGVRHPSQSALRLLELVDEPKRLERLLGRVA